MRSMLVAQRAVCGPTRSRVLLPGSRRWYAARNLPVILVEDVPKLGARGEVVVVRPGFARNHLFPERLAVYDSLENRLKLEPWMKSVTVSEEIVDEDSARLKKRLGQIEVLMKRQVVDHGSDGKPVLHAPVTLQNILHKLKRQHDITLDPEQVGLSEPITVIGLHRIRVTLDLGSDVKTEAALTVRLQQR